MSWDIEMPLALRFIINDVDDPQQYTDSRLQTAILVGARFTYSECSFNNAYYADIIKNTLNPDPTITTATSTGADQWFVNLTLYKTSLMMLRNNLKIAANSAYLIQDEGMKADLRQIAVHQKELLKDAENGWEDLKRDYMLGHYANGQAILTPFNILAGGFRSPLFAYSDRDRVVW